MSPSPKYQRRAVYKERLTPLFLIISQSFLCRILHSICLKSLSSVNTGAAYPTRLILSLVTAPGILIGDLKSEAHRHILSHILVNERSFDMKHLPAALIDSPVHALKEFFTAIRVGTSCRVILVRSIVDAVTVLRQGNTRGAGE